MLILNLPEKARNQSRCATPGTAKYGGCPPVFPGFGTVPRHQGVIYGTVIPAGSKSKKTLCGRDFRPL